VRPQVLMLAPAALTRCLLLLLLLSALPAVLAARCQLLPGRPAGRAVLLLQQARPPG
jgi:hypothetical protein